MCDKWCSCKSVLMQKSFTSIKEGYRVLSGTRIIGARVLPPYSVYISFYSYYKLNPSSISTSFVFVYVLISIHVCYLLILRAYYVFRRACRVAKTRTPSMSRIHLFSTKDSLVPTYFLGGTDLYLSSSNSSCSTPLSSSYSLLNPSLFL